jgi:YbbR domain-containing protein
VLAVFVWLLASQSARPLADTLLPPAGAEPLAVEFVNVPDGWAVVEPSAATARVELRGVREALEQLSPADLTVRVDLAHAVGSERVTVPLRAACAGCGRQAVRVRGVRPPAVTLRLEPARSRAMLVEPELGAAPATGCRRIETTVSPREVTVSGAESRLAVVTRAVATVPSFDVEATTARLTAVPIVALDAAGRPVSDVAIEPAAADLAIAVVQVETCAEVAVIPVYAPQNPAAGYYVADIDVDPLTVEVEGDPERVAALRELGTVSTQAVDIEGATDLVTRQVALDLPEGLSALGAAAGVTVSIQVSPYPGTRPIEVLVETGPVPPGLELEGLSPQRIQVLLGGPLPVLDALAPEELRAVLDLSAAGVGLTRLRPRIEAPAGLRVRSTAPSEIEVRLRRAGEAP